MAGHRSGAALGKAGGPQRFVLVVDGSIRDASFTAMLLQKFGYTAAMARSGEEALEFMAITPPAMVITELVLSGMNGFDLFERIKQDPAAHAAPVLIQTRLADLETEDRCRRIGCAGYLNKPVQHDDLYRAVQQALEPTPRRNIRVPVHLKAVIDGVSGDGEAVTVLSDAGLFVSTLAPRSVGSRHVVTFLLGTRVIRSDAAVLYAYESGNSAGKDPGMGMKFLNLSPVDRDVIQDFISEQVQPVVRPSSPV